MLTIDAKPRSSRKLENRSVIELIELALVPSTSKPCCFQTPTTLCQVVRRWQVMRCVSSYVVQLVFLCKCSIFPLSRLVGFGFRICLGAIEFERALVPRTELWLVLVQCSYEATKTFQSRFPKVAFFCSCCSHTSTLVRKVPSCGVC